SFTRIPLLSRFYSASLGNTATRSLWAVRWWVQPLLASSAASDGRGWLHPFSTLKAVRLEKEVQGFTARYQRAVTDGENIRRRTQRCVEDAKIFGIQSFCKDLVEVADILEKTTECISEKTEPGDQKLTLEKIFRGLSFLETKLKSVFAKHGLEKLTPIGDKYDPHEHELICHVPPGVGVQPGTVASVRQDGYKLHGCVIRLAQVEVVVGSQRRL
uniref:GrpE protein homolog n=1 Tax=Monodon monoceros TaxID=40151 RepID=A0A8C6BZN1_MONMO